LRFARATWFERLKEWELSVGSERLKERTWSFRFGFLAGRR
jgi:hypothetical protein